MERPDVNEPKSATPIGLISTICDWQPVEGPRPDVLRYPVLIGTLRLGPFELRVHKMNDGTHEPEAQSVKALFEEA